PPRPRTLRHHHALPTTFEYDVRGYDDETNNELYGVTSLVNDKSRVYKGGSWNDRAYWLNPATRRHMQQDESNAMTGLRCAMTLETEEHRLKSSHVKISY